MRQWKLFSLFVPLIFLNFSLLISVYQDIQGQNRAEHREGVEDELKESLLKKSIFSDRYFTCFFSLQPISRKLFSLSLCGRYLATTHALSADWHVIDMQHKDAFSSALNNRSLDDVESLIFPSVQDRSNCYYYHKNMEACEEESCQPLEDHKNYLWIWNVQNKERLIDITNLKSPATALTFSLDGTFFCYGLEAGDVVLAETLSSSDVLFSKVFNGSIRKLIISSNNNYLIVQYARNKVCVIDINSGTLIYEHEEASLIKKIHLNPCYPLLAIESSLANCVQIVNFTARTKDEAVCLRQYDRFEINKEDSSFAWRQYISPFYSSCIFSQENQPESSDTIEPKINYRYKQTKGHSYFAFSPNGEYFAIWLTDPENSNWHLVKIYQSENIKLITSKIECVDIGAGGFAHDNSYFMYTFENNMRTCMFSVHNDDVHTWYTLEDERGRELYMSTATLSCSPNLDYIFIGGNNNVFKVMKSFKSLSCIELEQRARWWNYCTECSVM